MRHSPLLLFFASAALAQTAIDFSFAGYGGGGVTTPAIPAVISVQPSGGDDTALLQGALDRVAAMTARNDGFRGAVLLHAGQYRVAGHLEMRVSGVVLRGSRGATIVAAGNSRRTLIEVGSIAPPQTGRAINITDETVPAGARVFTVDTPAGLQPHDHVVLTRPSTAAWIASLHMSGLPGTYANQRLDWLPGSRNLIWDRTIVLVDAAHSRIIIDAPITTALERRFGGGTLAVATSGMPVTHIGIENLVLDSEFDAARPKDEDHAWIAVAFDHVEDAWARGVTARHFAASAIRLGQRARRVTVEDCRSEQPVSEIGGFRRQSFLVEGQQVLVHNCSSEQGLNDFASGLLAGGPNVFLDAAASKALGPSGSFESWSSGVLYERVRIEGAGLRLANDSSRAQGAGWTAANSVAWNCDANPVEALGPEGAANIATRSTEPLYEKQLFTRGRKLPTWISPVDGAVPAFLLPARTPAAAVPSSPLQIVNGRFVVNGRAVWGGILNEGWWRGQANAATALDVGGVSITRFVPGRTGLGLTEDLDALARRMLAQSVPFYQAIPGLWYDRRRDEHSTGMRQDPNVWAPFLEMPWARSGKGTASDGLSLFDLSQFNAWYFGRLREFAALCDRYGLVLFHNIYNTHNLLEIPPHWVDYPWRPANNVNDTGLPEPPPYDATNHIHIANQVYDVSDPRRRELHRALILHELDELGSASNLLFSLGAQFAGPLEFQEFFQDTVAEWQQKTGRTVRIHLATSKDITDAILANPARARQVAAIDMRYWQYRPDGSLWAPPGGKNLAFREAITADFGRSNDTPPDTTPQQVYRLVREYHDRYPDKALIAWNGGAGAIPVLMAGGAQALMVNPSAGQSQGRTDSRNSLDTFVQTNLAAALMAMQPRDGVSSDAWCLADDREQAVLLYSLAGDAITLTRALKTAGNTGVWFDPRTGKTQLLRQQTSGAIRKPTPDPWLLLLTAKPR